MQKHLLNEVIPDPINFDNGSNTIEPTLKEQLMIPLSSSIIIPSPPSSLERRQLQLTIGIVNE